MRMRVGAFEVLVAALLSATPLVSCESAAELPPLENEPDAPDLEPVARPDGPATRLMYALSERGIAEVSDRVDRVVETDDERFVAVFIELIRASELGYGSPKAWADPDKIVASLEALSGESFGEDWQAWSEWYGQTDLDPPPGFTGWKGELLSDIDPAFGSFLRDGAPSRIRVEEIQWGGVVLDGIPALDDATMVEPEDATYLTPAEPVIGLSVEDDARAYPLRILDWHEMANDVVGGVPVSIAYCTLCGSAVAYDGRASNGTTYTFGSSGLLYESNKLMYDRNTRTLWSQFTGEPRLGELADDDVELERLPLVITAWEDWLEQQPGTMVLDIDTGFERPYTLGAAYGEYFESRDTLFPVAERSGRLPTKERIYGLNLKGRARAYPLGVLSRREVVNDRLGGTSVVIIATRGTIDVAARDRPKDAGDAFYDAGGEVRSYERGKWSFRSSNDPDAVIDQRGREWRLTDDALVGPGGRRLDRITGQLAYWFAWFTFFPLTEVYEDSSSP